MARQHLVDKVAVHGIADTANQVTLLSFWQATSARHDVQLRHVTICTPALRYWLALTIAASFTKSYLLLGQQELFTRDSSGYRPLQLHAEEAFSASGSLTVIHKHVRQLHSKCNGTTYACHLQRVMFAENAKDYGYATLHCTK